MPPRPLNPEIYDSFSVFDRGMNSGVADVLLTKDQIAFGSNLTVRGTFAKPRPPWLVRTLNFGGNASLQTAVTKGLWQQACYYKYDNGTQVIMAAISGRLFEFQIGATTATVVERTGGNAQSAVATQAWMVQAEFYLIWNDGISLPVFYNGNTQTTSRSNGIQLPAPGYVGALTAQINLSGNIVHGTPPTYTDGTELTFNVSPAYTGNVGDTLLVGGSLGIAWQFYVTDVSNTSAIKAKSINLDTAQLLKAVSTITGFGSGSTFGFAPIPAGASVTNPTAPTQTPQLPIGRNLAYIQGRVIMALRDGKQFIYGDIVGGSSGTLANNFRDAVVNTTENAYITGGGFFTIPGQFGSIRAFSESAVLDASMGQGPLQIHTPDHIFSCAVPVDRLTWQNMTNPILSVSLIGRGGTGQNSTTIVNSDTLFRQLDGIGSLVLARRDFDTWGNVPISREVERVLNLDAQNLLPWFTSVFFDNRLLMSAGPTATAQGVYHGGLIALNADPISSLGGKAPSVYDGLWPGLNALQLVTGEFSLVNRCFAFTLDPVNGLIGLTEVLPQSATPDEFGRGGTNTQDNGTTSIVWFFESPTIFHEPELKDRHFKRLMAGEISVDSIIGQVDFSVFYQPDDYPNWIPWASWSECAGSGPNSAPQFRPRMGLGEPDATKCDPITNRPYREGYYFQVKIVIQGWCRFKGARFLAAEIPEPKFQAPKCATVCSNPVAAVT